MSTEKKNPAGTEKEQSAKKQGRFLMIFSRLLDDKKAMVGMVIVLIYVLVAIFCDQIAPYKASAMSADILVGPGVNGHIFGTDNMGRDLFSRTIVGTRYSIGLGVAATLISLFVALVLGSITGYVGGIFDEVLMRILDIIQSVPGTLLKMALAKALGAGYWNLVIAMGIGGIAGMTRLQRSCVLSVRSMEYVDAASATNCSLFRKIVKHIIPNAFAPTMVQATMQVGGTIIAASGLSLLGCGIPSNIPEWGALLSSGRDYIKNYSYLCICPGVVLIIFVLAVNLFGDGLRDALDPKLKR